jgi:NAD(P)-dependent dehydrogenase (short-subunit alcohol dehydrogenase family)
MTGLLDGKVALITGGASGIGLAGAKAFLREGASVLLADIDGAAAETSAKELGHEAAIGFACDVRSETEVTAAFDHVLQRWGHLDIVWNNAGVESLGPMAMTSDDDFHRIFDTNVLGVLHGSRLALTRMVRGGVILNTASVAGLSGVSMQALYAASKAAVISLTKTAALEGGELGIRCNCLCPAVVNTPLLAKTLGAEISQELYDRLASLTALNRLIEPEEVADAAVFLVSDRAGFVSGLAFTIDGAMSAGPQQTL